MVAAGEIVEHGSGDGSGVHSTVLDVECSKVADKDGGGRIGGAGSAVRQMKSVYGMKSGVQERSPIFIGRI